MAEAGTEIDYNPFIEDAPDTGLKPSAEVGTEVDYDPFDVPRGTTERMPQWDSLAQDIPTDIVKSHGGGIQNALSISSAQDMPLKQAFDMQESFKEQYGEADLWGKAQSSFKAGIGDVSVGVGSTMKWLGYSEEEANMFTDYGERLRSAYIPPMNQSDFTWDRLADPDWWATTGARSVPFTLSLIPASIAAAYGGTKVGARVAGRYAVGKFGTTILKTLGGSVGATAVSRPMESAFEAGGIYDEALAKGMSEEEAQAAANETFWGNMKLAGMDVAQLAIAFSPLRVSGNSMKKVTALRRAAARAGKIVKPVAKIGAVGVSEGAEERYQEVVGRTALDEDVSFFDFKDPRLNEATAIGGAFGVGLGGTGSVFTSLTKHVVDGMPKEVKEVYTEAKESAVEEDVRSAEIQALDAVAETPEGESYIAESIEALKEASENTTGVDRLPELRRVFDRTVKQETVEPTIEVSPEEEVLVEAALDLIIEGAELETLTEADIEARLPIEEVTPEVIAEQFDLDYNGIQEFPGKEPLHLFTLKVEGAESTFPVESLDPEVVEAKVKEVKGRFGVEEVEPTPQDRVTKGQVPAKKVKGIVRRATGQIEAHKMIREDKALFASFKKAEQAARTAFREGKKEAVVVERMRMKDIIAKARGRIQETATINKLKKSILKELKTSKVKRGAKGKFTADVQAVLDKFNNALKLTETQAVEKIADNLEKYEGKTMPSEIVTENKILFMSYKLQQTDKGTDKAISVPLRKRFNEAELSKVLQEIKDLKNEGRMLSFLGKLDRSESDRAAVDSSLDVITGGKGLPAGLETVGVEKIKISPKEFKEWTKQFASNLGVHFVGWNDLMDMLSARDKSEPGKSRLNELAEVHGAETAEKAGRRTANDKIADMAIDAFSFENNRAMLTQFNLDAKKMEIGSFVNAVGAKVDLVMTKAEARKFMMEYADPSLRETFSLGMKYTDDMVQAINNTLTAQDKAFMGQQMNFYRDYYSRVNAVYRDIYGVDLPFNEFYTPIQREGVSVTEGVYGEFLDEVSYRRSVTSGSLKSRVKNVSRIAKRSDVNVLERHIADMEHFIAWSERISELNAIFKNQDIRTAIKLHHGKTMLGVIDKFINNFTRGGIETSSRLHLLDKIRGNFTRSVLAVKPTIAIKQTTSTAAYGEVMPIKDLAIGLASFWAHPVKNFKFLKENSVWFAERAEHMERDIKTAMRMREYSAYRKGRGFFDLLMLNVAIGDQGAIAMGGFAYYKYLTEKKGMSQKDAILEFEKFSEMTQQSSDLSMQSHIQRMGSFAKLFSMFLSSSNLYLRKEMGAIRNLMAGRGRIRDHIKTIVIYHFVLPMLFQWVSDGFDWDKDEQKRAVIVGPLNGIFIASDGIDFIVRKALGMRTFSKEVAIYSGVNDIGKFITEAMEWLAEGNMTDEDFYRAIRGLAGGVGAFTGLPLKQAVDQLKTGENFVDGEYEKALKGALGYSPYMLDKDKDEDEVYRVE